MSLQQVHSGERVHISFFGLRNAGKSSLVNAVTGQSLSVVSDVQGTTTDPVKKSMELLPIGPVVIIDTPGFDDSGELGELRVKKTKEILNTTDVAVVVTDEADSLSNIEKEYLQLIKEREISYIVVHNKADLLSDIPVETETDIWVSALEYINIEKLKSKLGELAKTKQNDKRIVSDLLEAGDIVILVTPIDESAPKGRLILPQQQTIRDVLDSHAISIVCQIEELEMTIKSLVKPPRMVITDSQAFGKVANIVPEDILLTSFSILFARYKGELDTQVKGASMLSKLKENDKILIAEGCTHHRQCGDIGTVKLPALIRKYTGINPIIEFTSGNEFPEDLSEYKLVVHCGGCMLTENAMKHRISIAKTSNTPIVNYGVAIAHMNGILARSLEVFGEEFILSNNN